MTELIAKGAANAARFRARCLFYRSAREGFEDMLRSVLGDPSGGVLLPAFIGWSPREGSGVFDPVRATGAAAGFYELNPDLTIDMGKLEQALERHRPLVIVLIHYFGRTEPRLGEVRSLAERFGAILVEDLAHGFFSAAGGGPAGRSGAVGLFSLHKMLPTPIGGMLRYRDEALITTQAETAPELARLVLDYDWPEIAAARRRNFAELSERLESLPERGDAFELLWPELAPNDVPQTLPVRIRTGGRDHVYAAMNADGYGMTSLYHTLIDELQAGFAPMIELSREITNFPVHQDADARHLDGMVASFRTALRRAPR